MFVVISPYAYPGIRSDDRPGYVKAPVTVERIFTTVCRHQHIEEKDVLLKTRIAEAVYCRQLTMYLSRQLTHATLKTLANFFTCDHTTVIHSVQKIEGLVYIKDRLVLNDLFYVNMLI